MKGIALFTEEDIDFSRIPNELAILVGISNRANDHFNLITKKILKNNYTLEFIYTWVTRVLAEIPRFSINEYLAFNAFLLYERILDFNSDDLDFKRTIIALSKLLIVPVFIKSINKLEGYYCLEPTVVKRIMLNKKLYEPGMIIEILPKDNYKKGEVIDKKIKIKIKVNIDFLKDWIYLKNLIK